MPDFNELEFDEILDLINETMRSGNYNLAIDYIGEAEIKITDDQEYNRPLIYYLAGLCYLKIDDKPKSYFWVNRAKEAIPKAMQNHAFINVPHVAEKNIDTLINHLKKDPFF